MDPDEIRSTKRVEPEAEVPPQLERRAHLPSAKMWVMFLETAIREKDAGAKGFAVVGTIEHSRGSKETYDVLTSNDDMHSWTQIN
ncbi:uncharacterized protein BDV14DRAFT_201092 [Aspergillus stella-maris]|uniref:uncharacterized protein n=1 Tax=Aspergillus stella-maris TaxID=1810926 RepID=UPI003CCD5B84